MNMKTNKNAAAIFKKRRKASRKKTKIFEQEISWTAVAEYLGKHRQEV
jgi:hypothetical protein